jgi:hypothetical protein
METLTDTHTISLVSAAVPEMPPYKPASPPAPRQGREDVARNLQTLVAALDLSADDFADRSLIPTACLRIAASYRARICEARPELWRSFEIYYRQHIRAQLAAGEVRHWDAALRLPE